MKKMTWIVMCLVVICVLSTSCSKENVVESPRILVITGGHEFTTSFFEIFNSYTDVTHDTVSQPRANKLIASADVEKYDALVFYDMWQEITPDQKKAYLKMLNDGKGMVFLHHSLVSYQKWDEFIKIVGGQYIEGEFHDPEKGKVSSYAEDISLDIKVVDKLHPVTEGIDDFTLIDEGYKDVKILPDIHPLLAVSHAKCAPYVAWVYKYNNARIVYIMLGHGPEAHSNPNYRKLIRNAISWVAKS